MYVLRTMNSLRMSFWMVPLSCAGRHALLLGRDDVERHDRQHRAVHRHRDRHLVERDLIEEDLHVLDRVDRHARLADVADDALVVRVVAAVRREIEGHRQALLPGGEVAAVEGVGLLGRREARVLPDRPRLQRVHRRVRAAQERRQAGGILEVLHALEIVGGVHRLDRDVLGREPARPPDRAQPARGTGGRSDSREVRYSISTRKLRAKGYQANYRR